MTKEQPEFRDDVMDKIKFAIKDEESFTLTVTGDWEEMLSDVSCKTPKSATLLFKTSSEKEWQRRPLVIDEEQGLLEESFQLHKTCSDYSFQLEISGFAGTDPIMTYIDVDSDIFSQVDWFNKYLVLTIIFQLQNNLPLIQKLSVHIFESSLQVEMTVSGCHDGYYFMVTTDSTCTNCLKLDSGDHGSGDLDDTENVEDFTSTDGGHISLETGNSAFL